MKRPIERPTTPGVFIGEGQVNALQLVMVRRALSIWDSGFRLTRAPLRHLLAIVTSYTGDRYPSSKKGREAALDAIEALLAQAKEADGDR